MAMEVQPSDEQLLARMAARDSEALAALYDRYSGVVMAFALRMLRDRAEAEETTVDVFHQAWRMAEAFDATRGSVVAWLMTLSRSRAIDRLRSRQRRAELTSQIGAAEAEAAGIGVAAGPAPDEQVEIGTRKRRVTAALSSLSEAQRTAIELAYYEGLSHSEIATRLGEPLGTVKTRIRQGMMSLRSALDPRSGT